MNEKMKAFVYNRYGPPEVLYFERLQKPIPKKNEILVKVHAASVTSGDIRMRSSNFPLLFWLPARLVFGIFHPKKQVLGTEFSGKVVKCGESVSKFKIGDKVVGTTTGLQNAGGYSEYLCVPEKWKQGVVSLKSTALTFEEAACLPVGGMTALYLLKKAKIKSATKVLVYGASGSVGSYAVQLAKYFGSEVTGVSSTNNLDLVRSIGATHAFDYTKKDISHIDEKFDVILDAVGKISRSQFKHLLSSTGNFVTVKSPTKEITDDLQFLIELSTSGEIRPVIDRIYEFDDIVEAHRYVDQGHKKGNVGIRIISKECEQ